MSLLALGLGVIVGIISGIVGIGGGIVLVPALVFLFKMSQHKAQGTSLATLLLPIGLLAVWKYYKAGEVDIKVALLLAIGFTAGGYFGGVWAQEISDPLLRRIFAGLLGILALKMFFQR